MTEQEQRRQLTILFARLYLHAVKSLVARHDPTAIAELAETVALCGRFLEQAGRDTGVEGEVVQLLEAR